MYHEKWGFLVIFWNFAGVPFVSYPATLYFDWLSCFPISVLRLLCRIHGLTRPIQISVLGFDLHCHVHYTLDCLLHVRLSLPQLP